MKLTAERTELAEALRWVALAIDTKPNIAALAGVHVKAEGDSITLTGHDFDTVHRARVPAEVKKAGECVAAGYMVRDLVAALKAPAVDITLDKGALGIKAGRSTYSVATFAAGEWPEPQTTDAPVVGKVDADVLATGLAQVVNAADDDNPVTRLRGVRLEAANRQLYVVGMRTSALAIARGKWQGKKFTSQLPMKFAQEAVKGLSGLVEVSADDSVIGLATEARTVVLRLYGAELADWQSVIPEMGTVTFEAEAELLLDAVRRAALTCAEGDPLTLKVSEAELEVTAGSAATATGVEYVDGAGSASAEMSFAPDVLVGTLAVLPAGPVTLTFGAPGQRQTLQVKGKADDFHHVVMPRKAAR